MGERLLRDIRFPEFIMCGNPTCKKSDGNN